MYRFYDVEEIESRITYHWDLDLVKLGEQSQTQLLSTWLSLWSSKQVIAKDVSEDNSEVDRKAIKSLFSVTLDITEAVDEILSSMMMVVWCISFICSACFTIFLNTLWLYEKLIEIRDTL